MTTLIFNTSLLLGWLLIVVGVGGLLSVWAAFLVGGGLLMGVTLLLARWAGVFGGTLRQPKGKNVSE